MTPAALDQRRRAQGAATEATLDWASDPCSCGRFPLSIFNRSGRCRKCTRRGR